MTDADLIYNALLRAERKLESSAKQASGRAADMQDLAAAMLEAVQILREEIGNGLAKESQ